MAKSIIRTNLAIVSYIAILVFVSLQVACAEGSRYKRISIKDIKTKMKEKLTPLQYKVAYENGTEAPFNNLYWDNKAEGIYVDIVSKKPLFVSVHKYKSGTGWPSFYQTINKGEVIEKKDASHGMKRIEVRTKTSDIHLGHVFPDGPKPTGLRYCINSASLEFIPKEKLKERGYADLLKIFNKIEPEKNSKE